MAENHEELKCECREAYEDIDRKAEEHSGDPSALIEVLHYAQERLGYVLGTFRYVSQKNWVYPCPMCTGCLLSTHSSVRDREVSTPSRHARERPVM